jgi:hypothetical protein
MSSTTPPIASGALAAAHAAFAGLRQRARRGIWIEALGVLGLLLVAYAIPSYLTDRGLRLERSYRAVLLVSFVAVVVRIVRQRLLRPLAVRLDDDEIALAVERQAPDVRQALISSLQFDRVLDARAERAESRELMSAVVADVRARLATIPFARAIDVARVRRYATGIAAAALFFAAWAGIDGGSLGLWARRNLLLADVDWPRYTTLAFGDASGSIRMPQGDALTVRVTAEGPVPDQVFLDYEFAGGDAGAEPMSRTGANEFTLTLDAVLEDVVLRAAGGDALPIKLRVQIVERPRIDDLAIRVTYPAYMEREPETVPPTEGELRLPRGAVLAVEGRSQKPLDEAFLLFGGEQKIALPRDPSGFAFRGEFSPAASGLLVVDVVDRDRLGAGAPPKLLLRIGDDRPPTIDFKLLGIGSLIASHARIPGDLKVRDDFGLREVDAAVRVVADNAAEAKPPAGEAPPPEIPFEPAAVVYGAPLRKSALRYETTAVLDLGQFNLEAAEDGARNRIKPGVLVSVRLGATDNFGPGEPHHGYGETMTFRVVTRERLAEELRRRQVEQRQELERLIQEEQTALLEVREMANPAQAGDKAALVRQRLKALARQQQTLGRRTAFVGETYQRILWEFENNRLWEPNKVREIEGLITVPLAAVSKEAFPASSREVDAFGQSGDEASRKAAISGYEEILRRLAFVLNVMEQAENLAALLEDLRVVIKIEDSAIQEVEKRLQKSGQDVFGPGKDPKPK